MARSFGEGFSSAFNSTFSALSEAEARKKANERAERELAMRETEFQQKQKEQQALRAASADTFGRVGKTALTGDLQADTGIGSQQARALNVDYGDAEFAAADRAQLADTLRANAERQGAAVPALPTMTREMADQQYADRLSAIDPTRGQQFRQTGQQIKKGEFELGELQRTADFNKRVDDAMQGLYTDMTQRMMGIETVAQTDGMKGLVTTYGPELKKAFPGMDVSLVGNNIVVKQGKKTVQTIGNLDQAVKALQGVAQFEFSDKLERTMITKGLFKNPQELVSYFRDKNEDARKGRETDSLVRLRGAQGQQAQAAAGYYNRGGASANRQTQGQILNERIDAYSAVLRRADPNLTKEEADKRAAQVIMRDPEAKPAREVTPADINGFLKDQASAVIRRGDDGKPVRLSDLPLAEQRQIAIETLGGSAPAAGGGGLPDFDPTRVPLPGQPGQPGQSTAKPAALPLQDRLSQAIQADAQRTDRRNFLALSEEVARNAPNLQSQIKALQTALPSATTPQSKAILESQIEALEQELQLVPGILQQRQAILGR